MFKKVLVFICVGLFALIISWFIFSSTDFSPFKQDMIQELIESNRIEKDDWETLNNEIQNIINRGLIISYLSTNAYILMITILTTFFCFFCAGHLAIDKFFFKNFYESASLFDAMRRGFLLILAIGLFVMFRLYKVEEYIILLVPVSALLLELLYIVYFKNGRNRNKLEESIQEDALAGN